MRLEYLALVAVLLLFTGCVDDDSARTTVGRASDSTTTVGTNPASPGSSAPPTSSNTTGSGPDSGPCESDKDRSVSTSGCCTANNAHRTVGQAFLEGPTVELEHLGESRGVVVEGALYPHPDYEGRPWSQWGQGLTVDDGRFFSAIGDHIGPDGNSYLYEFDPGTNRLQMIGDVLAFVEHEPGSWGYGKIHGQFVAGSCGEMYLSTYWGTSRDLEFGGSYSGDILMRLDPARRTIQPLGVPVERHGQASISSDPSRGLVYGEATDPETMSDGDREGRFFVYDTRSEKVIFSASHAPLGYRNVMVDGRGRAYYSEGDGRLSVYDPESNSVATHEHEMPGSWLRASTRPAPDGRIFGVTRDPDRFFVMEPSGEIVDLGEARGYTASMALTGDGDGFYYIPDAHGGSWRQGSPIIAVDGDTGEQSVVVELNPIVEKALNHTVGGTYNIATSPDGKTIYVGVNASRVGDDSRFGEVILLIVHLP